MVLTQPEVALFDLPASKTPPKANTKWIGSLAAEIWPFEIFQNATKMVGRLSVVNIHTSYADVI